MKMLNSHVALVNAVGFDAKKIPILDLLSLSRRIENDSVIFERKRRMVEGQSLGVLQESASLEIVQTMPPAELAALRERVK
jgi:hypothetical protein